MWVTNSAADSVSRIDPEQNVSVPINLEPGSSPSGVAVGAGAVWVANSGNATVSQDRPGDVAGDTSIPVRPGPTGIVVAFGSVWVTNALDASVTEIDPDTNKVRKVVPVGAGPTGIAAGAGYLWVTNQGDGTVTRFHPDTYVTDSAVTVGQRTGGDRGRLAARRGWRTTWTGPCPGSTSTTSASTSRTLAKGGGAYGVAARGGDVWVSNEHAGTLMRVTAQDVPAGRDGASWAAPRSGWRSSGTTCGSPAPQAAARCTAAASSPWSGHGQVRVAGRPARPRPHRPVTTSSPGGWPR